MKKPELPKGWTQKRVARVLAHDENQTDAEAVAEDEAALGGSSALVQVPPALIGKVRQLIARHTNTRGKRPMKRLRGAA
jgi:hypothetical protein